MPRLTLGEQLTEMKQRCDELTSEAHDLRAQLVMHQTSAQHLEKELEAARAQLQTIPELRGQIENLTKERDSAKTMQEHYRTSAAKFETEVEQSHAVLDGVEGAPTRTYEQEYGKGHRTVVTRLAGAFLAMAKNGGGVK